MSLRLPYQTLLAGTALLLGACAPFLTRQPASPTTGTSVRELSESTLIPGFTYPGRAYLVPSAPKLDVRVITTYPAASNTRCADFERAFWADAQNAQGLLRDFEARLRTLGFIVVRRTDSPSRGGGVFTRAALSFAYAWEIDNNELTLSTCRAEKR